MNTQKLYVASLRNVSTIQFKTFSGDYVCKHNRLVLVKESIFDKFLVRDLITNRIYRSKLKPFAEIGDRYVSKETYMPFNTLTENAEINLSKKKILKIFNNTLNNKK